MRRWWLGGALVLGMAVAVWQFSGLADLTPPPVAMVEQAGRSGHATIAEAALHGAPMPVRITGRGVSAPMGFMHQWPAIHVTARVSGNTVVAAFDDAANRYRITVDAPDGPVFILHRPGKRAFRLAGLGPDDHLIRIEKLTESEAVGTFAGLFATAARTPPAVPLRQIEVIGDSDSVGLASLSNRRDCASDMVFFTTDTSAAYGPRVARHFDAEYQVNARSGIGLVRNYDGAPGLTMDALYPRALFGQPTPAEPGDWAPQVVMILLGSNDFSTPLRPGEIWPDPAALQAGFETAYVQFLADLRARHPQALLLMLATPTYGEDYLAAHRAVAARTQTALVVLPEIDRTACLWHPSQDDHARIADAIIADLAARPGIWPD